MYHSVFDGHCSISNNLHNYKGQVIDPKCRNSHFTIHFEPPKRGQPLYKGQHVWSQGVFYNGGSTSTVLLWPAEFLKLLRTVTCTVHEHYN